MLAIELHADLLLMDDSAGLSAARRKGFRVAGTLGVLSMAAQQDLLDSADATASNSPTSLPPGNHGPIFARTIRQMVTAFTVTKLA